LYKVQGFTFELGGAYRHH